MNTKLNPQPEVWPECSKCGTPWVLRRCFTVGEEIKAEWVWSRDCKHRADARVGRLDDHLAAKGVSA